MKALSTVTVNAPVEQGDVVLPAVCGESDIIATGSIK